jgi:N-acetylglucosamine kinase-like BadF-type ATPase
MRSISEIEEKQTDTQSEGAGLQSEAAGPNVEPQHGLRFIVTGKGGAGSRVSAQDYYLGIDGGGTKTQAVVMSSSRQVLGEGTAGASNPLRVGIDQAMENIITAAAEAVEDAGLRIDKVASAVVALAGISHPIHFHAVKQALDRALGVKDLELVTDAEAALVGALDGQPGVVIIAGTGSIALGVNRAGEMVRSGGWGPELSDEGSGYDIARRALRAVAAEFDGRSPSTRLSDLILRRLGVETAADLPGVIYSSNRDPVEIASLAELVSEAAESGDEVAGSILSAAGTELGHLAVSVIERLRMASCAFRIALVGSVFKAGEPLISALKARVLGIAPNAEFGQPLFPPTVGAARLAQSLADAKSSKDAADQI